MGSPVSPRYVASTRSEHSRLASSHRTTNLSQPALRIPCSRERNHVIAPPHQTAPIALSCKINVNGRNARSSHEAMPKGTGCVVCVLNLSRDPPKLQRLLPRRPWCLCWCWCLCPFPKEANWLPQGNPPVSAAYSLLLHTSGWLLPQCLPRSSLRTLLSNFSEVADCFLI